MSAPSDSLTLNNTDIVKSAYMIDPSDGLTLIKRDGHDTTEIDREYWQRVNKVFIYGLI